MPNTDKRLKNEKKFPERNLTNENDPQNSPNRGDDIIVPGISENDARNESLSPRGGKNNLRPNPNPNYSEDSILRIEFFPKMGVLFCIFFIFSGPSDIFP